MDTYLQTAPQYVESVSLFLCRTAIGSNKAGIAGLVHPKELSENRGANQPLLDIAEARALRRRYPYTSSNGSSFGQMS